MAGLADAVLLLQAKNYSGSGNWLDESGNSHDGVISGATFVSAGTLSHFLFNGTSDYITVADHADLDFGTTDSLTLMVLQAPDLYTANMGIVVKRANLNTGSPNPGYGIRGGSGGRFGIFGDAAITEPASTTGQPDGVEQILTLRRDVGADTVDLLVDGVVAQTRADDTTATAANALGLEIGLYYNPAPGTQEFKGQIRAVVLWRSALTDAEVVAAGEALLAAGTPSMMLLGM